MKISKADFQKFKGYVNYWQRELGLVNWKVYVFHKKPEPGTYATTYTSLCSRTAAVHLALAWEDRPVDNENLKECALHEVMHIVTSALYEEAKARYTQEFDIDAAEHEIVIRVTNYIVRIEEKLP